jgi:hypothetical protein
MKKLISLAFTATFFSSSFATTIPAEQSQIAVRTYAIDIRAINDILASNDTAIAVYSAMVATDTNYYVLAPVTVPAKYNNIKPPVLLQTNPVFCQQESGECPKYCDIDVLCNNSVNPSLEKRGMSWSTTLAGYINNYESSHASSNSFNCFIISRSYLATIGSLQGIQTIVVNVGLTSDGKSLAISYFAVDANNNVVPGSTMADESPLAYYNATVTLK